MVPGHGREHEPLGRVGRAARRQASASARRGASTAIQGTATPAGAGRSRDDGHGAAGDGVRRRARARRTSRRGSRRRGRPAARGASRSTRARPRRPAPRAQRLRPGGRRRDPSASRSRRRRCRLLRAAAGRPGRRRPRCRRERACARSPAGRAIRAADPGRRRSRCPGGARALPPARRSPGPGARTDRGRSACGRPRRRLGGRSGTVRGGPPRARSPAWYRVAAGGASREHRRRDALLPRRDAQDPEGLRHHAREERRRDFRGVVLALGLLEDDDRDAARVVGGSEARRSSERGARPGSRRRRPSARCRSCRPRRSPGSRPSRPCRARRPRRGSSRSRARSPARAPARGSASGSGRSRPPGSTMRRHQVRLDEVAAVGDDRRDPRELQRVQGDLLPHRDRGVREARPPRQRPEDAGVLARQVDAGRPADAERRARPRRAVARPSRRPTRMMPMLDECSKTPASVSAP